MRKIVTTKEEVLATLREQGVIGLAVDTPLGDRERIYFGYDHALCTAAPELTDGDHRVSKEVALVICDYMIEQWMKYKRSL